MTAIMTAQEVNASYNRGEVLTRKQIQPLLDIRSAITQIVLTGNLRVEVIVTSGGNWAFESDGGSLMVPAPYAENWATENSEEF